MNGSTIAAIATPSGRGGIGIIRISGGRALSIALSIFKPHSLLRSNTSSCHFPPDQIFSHHLYYGTIVQPDTQAVLDEVLLAFMKAPHSYTREDVVEIQAHSGYAVLKAILNAVLQNGAELAGPGEFTRRAFLNGRIDLTQAEAVIDIINSKSEKALESAASQLTGAYKQHVKQLRDVIRDILVRIEASIDFPDEVEELQLLSVCPQLQSSVLEPILSLIQQYEDCHVIRDGYRISIIGRPNVGKSSLMNWLVKKDRSIVTDIPGTTRDVVEEAVIFRGIPVNFSDTAGIHITQNTVELLGIEKTYECIHASDLILMLLDASVSDYELENQLLDMTGSVPVILVFNKIDLAADPDYVIENNRFSTLPSVAISVKEQTHMETLVDLIVKKVHEKSQGQETVGFIPNLRQARAFEKAAAHIRQAMDGIQRMNPSEVIVMDIRDAMDSIDEVSGVQTTDEVLDHIFNSFCIGK
ncbi:MAG: tRNA uridine-5-carboxymethylaminomethyl(34) synthesis GTPase MnmE [Deltaproteobacteria bacterium]|nr:tRNA uridine-5-carboxymethylaminomethyl(34) synthesis GTPase MnmE [Deltaproteobacteria bacterium]